jgi:hypothetical protein
MSTITIRPRRKRARPPDGIVRTVVQIGIHEITFETDFFQSHPGMQIIWIPGKPEGAEFLPQFQRRFERTRLQHLQKLADISQQPVTVMTTESLRELKEKVEHPKGEDNES